MLYNNKTSMNSINPPTISQKRHSFCRALGNLLNVYIFNEEITSRITLDAGKSAQEIRKSYDELVCENEQLKKQILNIRAQANIITENSYYQQKVRLNNENEKKLTHLTVIEKAKSDKYICCDICDRFVSKKNKQHFMTDICLSIRVSKELSKKSNKYILHKKKKRDCIIAYRNGYIMLMRRAVLMKQYTEFQSLRIIMNDKLAPLLKTK